MSLQSQASIADEGYESLSIGALMQSSAAALENECAILEKEIEEKSEQLQELKENCARHADNISKQQVELEHLKMKTYTEMMNREAFITKYSNLREKSETLDNYLRECYKGINHTLASKQDREEFSAYFSLKLEPETAQCECLEQAHNTALDKVNKFYEDMEDNRKKTKDEFEEIKTELKSQISQKTQQEKELEDHLREVHKERDERVIMIDLLKGQNEELKKKYEKLQNELATEVQNMKSVTSNLQSTLQKEMMKNSDLTIKLEEKDKMIHETNTSMRDKEQEIKSLDCKHKQLISKREEYTNEFNTEQEELNRLQTKCESLREQFNSLSKTDGENSALKLKLNELNETYENYKNKLADIQVVEESWHEEIEKLNKAVEEKEKEKSNTNEKIIILKKEIEELEKEIENIATEHKTLSIEIDGGYAELVKENVSLKEKLDDLAKETNEITKDKEKLESVITSLKTHLKKAKMNSEENSSKLFSYAEECRMILKNLKERESLVDEMMSRSEQDCEEAQSDAVQNMELKITIKQLEADLKGKQVDKTLQNLQISHDKQLETKRKLLEDLRAQHEREFRIKEQKKLDALVEVKENKTRISELQKRKSSVQPEMQRIRNNSGKCDNLLQKLESKLNNVVKVATVASQADVFSQDSRHTSVPQRVNPPVQPTLPIYAPHGASTKNFGITSRPMSSSSKSTNILDTPKQLPRNPQVIFLSPGSSSSGRTFNPDEVITKTKRKTFGGPSSQMRKPIIPQKRTLNPPTKKEESDNERDDWGFFK